MYLYIKSVCLTEIARYVAYSNTIAVCTVNPTGIVGGSLFLGARNKNL